jgi:PKD repeat protein
MNTAWSIRLSLCVSIALAAGCTVHQAETPGLTGPSELALSFAVTATPDFLVQNGFSPSTIVVTARGPNGGPVAGRDFALTLQPAFGTLSSKTVRTGSDGTGTAIYTPPTASPFVYGAPATTVFVFATSIGSDRQTANTQSAAIRVSPPPVPTDPGRPTASVTYSPSSPKVGDLIMFDASGSFAAPGNRIQQYYWDFGDGLPNGEQGNDASHIYLTAGTYTMVLGVVDDAGRIGSTFKTIVVTP